MPFFGCGFMTKRLPALAADPGDQRHVTAHLLDQARLFSRATTGCTVFPVSLRSFNAVGAG